MKAAYEKPETAASSLRNQHHNQHHHQQYHQSTNNYNKSNNTRSEGDGGEGGGDPANSSLSEYSADPSLPRNKRAAGLKVFARGCGVAGVLLLLLPLVVFLCMLLPDEFTEMNHWVRNGAMKKKMKKKGEYRWCRWCCLTSCCCLCLMPTTMVFLMICVVSHHQLVTTTFRPSKSATLNFQNKN